ncbi:MAG TPA: restriction endonuclease [Gammaproteobacteria bacterium]
MAIPDFQSLMLPLLRIAADGHEHALRDVTEKLSQQFNLTEEERQTLLPSGRQTTIANRVGWSRTFMLKAQLLESTRRGYFRITQRGHDLLTQNPERIDITVLKQYPEFVEFRNSRSSDVSDSEPASLEKTEATPEESLEFAYQRLRNELADELLRTIVSCTPAFFERLVVDLLVAMGYGGSRQDAGRAIGRSGDDGIDGIIKEDRLGLDIIYLQAKRWQGVVGRPEIQKFAGALQGNRARKGVFITTSSFTREADEYVSRIDSKIILIDGRQLAQLMIDHDVGVSTQQTFVLKRIDADYFSEE